MLLHAAWIEACVLVGLATGCKSSAADEPLPPATLVVEAPGELPAVVARSVDKAWHSKLRVTATAGDTKQTRDYTVVGAALSLAIGPHGEIDAPGARPESRHAIASSSEIGRVQPGAIADEETANELRWFLTRPATRPDRSR
jgi:hypothetical protein